MKVSAWDLWYWIDGDIPLALSREFLPEVGRVLVLDVLDNGIPAAVVVHEVTVARCVDDVQAQAHTVLLNHVGDSLDLASLSDGLRGWKATLWLDEVRGEDGVDQSGLAETGLANANDIELEAALEELLLDLGGDAVEANVALWEDALRSLRLRCTDVGHVGGGGGVFNGVSGVSAGRWWRCCLSCSAYNECGRGWRRWCREDASW
jgi:hypothetical protein